MQAKKDTGASEVRRRRGPPPRERYRYTQELSPSGKQRPEAHFKPSILHHAYRLHIFSGSVSFITLVGAERAGSGVSGPDPEFPDRVRSFLAGSGVGAERADSRGQKPSRRFRRWARIDSERIVTNPSHSESESLRI